MFEKTSKIPLDVASTVQQKVDESSFDRTIALAYHLKSTQQLDVDKDLHVFPYSETKIMR